MDIKSYIESGILESYVLGFCNEKERSEVELLCAKHAELKAELDHIQESINNYASMHGKTPRPIVKQQIFDEIDKLEQKTDAKIIPLPVQNYRIAIAATITLFALSFVANIIIYSKYKLASEQLLTLNEEKRQLAENVNTTRLKLESLSNDKAVIADPMVQKIMMKGVAKSPESLTMVYWNKVSKEVFIEIKNLPAPETGKQYQLWAIVDGKPVNAGMITLTAGDSSLHKMKPFEAPQAFAITLEKQGGSANPTLTEMYVMGAVGL